MAYSSSSWDREVSAASKRYGVPAALVKAIIHVETGATFNPAVRGAAGEYGLMQIMPATARAAGFTGDFAELLTPETNILVGTRHLAGLFTEAGGNVDAAVSAYNAGFSRDRPGDGKRIGNTHTEADRATPFINQKYVDDVRRLAWRYGVAGNLALYIAAAVVFALLVGPSLVASLGGA